VTLKVTRGHRRWRYY